MAADHDPGHDGSRRLAELPIPLDVGGRRRKSDQATLEALPPCPICGRPLVPGPSVDRHHWRPKSEGGTETALLHRVCHRMIHRLFDHATLATRLNTPEALRAEPEIERFVRWVRRQPPDYVDWPEQPGRRGRRR